MKRLLLPLLAGLALFSTGCSSDETVEMPKGQEIGFASAFVNKPGRAEDASRAKMNTCMVWGSSSLANGYIFDAQSLNVTGVTVEYSPLRYWSKETEYHFLALGSILAKSECYGDGKIWQYTPPADVPTTDGLFGTLTYNNDTKENNGAYGEEDLVYAGFDCTTTTDLTQAPTVKLVFQHALSRIRFLFVNAMDAGYYLEIKNVKVSGLPKNGTLDFASKTWTAENYALEKDFTVMASNTEGETQGVDTDPVLLPVGLDKAGYTETMFTIPDAQEFNVHFEANLWLKNEDGTYTCQNGENNPYRHDVKINVSETVKEDTDGDNVADTDVTYTGLRMNRAYALRATIGDKNITPDGLYPIKFEASVTEITGGPIEIVTIPATTSEEGK